MADTYGYYDDFEERPSAWPMVLAVISLISSSVCAVYVWTEGRGQPQSDLVGFWILLAGSAAAAFFALAFSPDQRLSRRMKLALITSLILHMCLSLGLRQHVLTISLENGQRNSPPRQEEVEPLPSIPDYFVPEATSDIEPVFEQPVPTERPLPNAENATRTATNSRFDHQRNMQVSAAPMEAAISPNAVSRRERNAPRRAVEPSRLSRQNDTSATLREAQIRAPAESLGQTSRQRLEAPRAAAERRLPQMPSLVRPSSPSQLRADAAVSSRALRRNNRSEAPTDSMQAERMQRRMESSELSATTARQVESRAGRIAQAAESMSEPSSQLARNRASLALSPNRSARRANSTAATADVGQMKSQRKSSSSESDFAAATQPLVTSSNRADLAETRATAPANSQGIAVSPQSLPSATPSIRSLARSSTRLPMSSSRPARQTTSAETFGSTGQVSSPDISARRQQPSNGSSGRESQAAAGALARRQSRIPSLSSGQTALSNITSSVPTVSPPGQDAGSGSFADVGTGSQLARRRSRGPAARPGRSGQSSGTSGAQADIASSGMVTQRRRSDEGEDSAGSHLDVMTGPAPIGRSPSTAAIAAERSGAGDLPDATTNVGEGRDDAAEGLAALPGPESGGLDRRSSRIPALNQAKPGPGGFASQAAPSMGLPSRRATRQSRIAHETPDRFLQRPTRESASISGKARDIAPAFARRVARRSRERNFNDGQPSVEVENTIEMGLSYLASIQMSDGRWSLQQTVPPGLGLKDATRAVVRTDTAATGLALLSFLGAGYDHLDGAYRENVRRGLNFLIRNQKPNGDLFVLQAGKPADGLWFYSHGIAAISLCEAFGMTGEEKLRAPAQRSLNFIIESQHPSRGGWRYSPAKMSDLSVSGWQLMAVRSGQLAGLKVPQETIIRTRRLLDAAQVTPENASEYVYNPWGNDTEAGRFGPRPNTVMSSVGMLMRLYTGWSRDHPAIQKGADRILTQMPNMQKPPAFAGRSNPMRDTYYWYNATQVMYHMQGEHWKRWKDSLYPMLSNTQQQSGPFAGSWDPANPYEDRWGTTAGRLYLTALNLLSLEVYHRHLPLFNEGLLVPSESIGQ